MMCGISIRQYVSDLAMEKIKLWEKLWDKMEKIEEKWGYLAIKNK